MRLTSRALLLAAGVAILAAVGWALLVRGDAGGSADAIERPPPLPPAGRIVYSAANGDLSILTFAGRTHRTKRLMQKGFSPAFDADGSEVVFGRREELFSIDADGGRVRQVTTTSREEWDPDWLSDDRIVYVAHEAPRVRLWIANRDGTKAREFSTVYGQDPAVSPDGRWVAFTGDTPATGGDILVMRSDGSDLRQVTDLPDWEVSPSWSPDGRRIAFSSGLRPDSTLAAGEIWVVNRDGTGAKRLTGGHRRDDVTPTWSPDGEWIAFSGSGVLRIVAADGSVERSLEVRGESPDWAR